MAAQRSNTQNPPLRRHPALQPLSREHMSGLIQARNLQRAARADEPARRAALDDLKSAWRTEISDHFDDEERLLLPLTADAKLRDRLLEEHRVIRELVGWCNSDPASAARDPQLLHRLGSLLHDHIRWEEREFFEAIQREQPEALEALTAEAETIEKSRPGSRARSRLEELERRIGQ